MKDSEDPWWLSVGDVYRQASAHSDTITIVKDIPDYPGSYYRKSKEFIYSGNRLLVLFPDRINDVFKVQDKVQVSFL
jgi:hypothetical protein